MLAVGGGGAVDVVAGGDYAVDDHSEEIWLQWHKAKVLPLEFQVCSYAEIFKS